MLDALRQGAQGWVSKLLMGLLVVSFAIWGIGGYEGYGAATLATVGDEQITIPQFARIQEQVQRSGQNVQPNQILQQLLLDAALDDEARAQKLGISDDRIATQIAANPAFKGAGGAFDRSRFTSLLANSGVNQDDYVQELRQGAVREQIAAAVGSGIQIPQPLVEALYRFQNEERTISAVVVDQGAIEPVRPPDDAALQAYFGTSKERFRAPEYRTIGLLTLDPAQRSDAAAVAVPDIAAEYERRKANYTRPERRRVEQIRFPTKEALQAALSKLNSGADFAAVAAENGVALAGLDQGLKTQAEFLDPAVAKAAFSAAPNAVVPIAEGGIEPSIIRLTEIEPGSVTPLADVSARLRQDLATRKAREDMQDVYDQVEDERAGGATLEEVAAKIGGSYRVIEVAADASAEGGEKLTDLPAQEQLLREAFESDVGVENNPIRYGDDAFVFYDVIGTVPARDRELKEVRDQVVSAWTAEETQTRIAERAEGLLGRLQKGETLETIAAEIAKPVQTFEHVKRGGNTPGLSANAAAQAFAGPKGHVANAEADQPPSRILLKVNDVTAPAFFAEAADSQAITSQLAEALRNDVLRSYNQQLLMMRKTHVNNAALAQITGATQTQ